MLMVRERKEKVPRDSCRGHRSCPVLLPFAQPPQGPRQSAQSTKKEAGAKSGIGGVNRVMQG